MLSSAITQGSNPRRGTKLENRGNTTFPRFFLCFQRFSAFTILRLSCDDYVSSVKITRKLHTDYI
nr:MAG TPA: hypothetical protein [Caudoviricetes sp.]